MCVLTLSSGEVTYKQDYFFFFFNVNIFFLNTDIVQQQYILSFWKQVSGACVLQLGQLSWAEFKLIPEAQLVICYTNHVIHIIINKMFAVVQVYYQCLTIKYWIHFNLNKKRNFQNDAQKKSYNNKLLYYSYSGGLLLCLWSFLLFL